MLVQATPVKKRTYTIVLASADVNSYQSATGTPWNATYFINLNNIMDDEEQARPYYVNFTFSSEPSADISNQLQKGELLLELSFGGRPYPHITQWSQRFLPCGFVKFNPPPIPAISPDAYLSAVASDNHPVYIHSLKNCASIGLRLVDVTGDIFTSTVPFVCIISLEPASF